MIKEHTTAFDSVGSILDDTVPLGPPKSLDENYPEDYNSRKSKDLEKLLVIDAYTKYFTTKGENVTDYTKTNPKHYRDASIEPIDVIESWNLGFHLGNALKYIKRAGLKEDQSFADDISKAIWYLQRSLTLK